MKKGIALILVMCSTYVYSQDFNYQHDDNGNRVLREVITYGYNKANDFNNTNTSQSQAAVGFLLEYPVSVYPNPTVGVLKVDLEGFEEKGELEILDIQGKQVLSLPMYAKNEIDMTGLTSGTYLLRLRVNGIAKTWRIVKQDD